MELGRFAQRSDYCSELVPLVELPALDPDTVVAIVIDHSGTAGRTHKVYIVSSHSSVHWHNSRRMGKNNRCMVFE